MTYREAFTALVDALAAIYFDKGSIHRIIGTTGLPIGHIRISDRAVETWADVLSKARRDSKVEGIFAIVLAEYPVERELHAAVAGYRDVVAQGGLPPPSLRRCDFYAHVSLPPNFVARPALLNDVREMLLATPTMALTSAIPTDALHGMGGIGKSVVARALCDDPEVQDVFSDGILWATIGQTPELIPRLREWVEALGGIIPQTAPTINQLKQNLAELLTDRACLLILDDVWHRSDAEPFLVGGPRCRLLLTTRDSEVARGLGAGVHAVPAMDPDEAVNLLELWADGALHQADESLKRQIVRRLGYLPLAIKLAGSQLQRRSPERWLASFDATQLQERRVEKVHDSLARTFALSLDELEATERRLYVALAIFREDEATPMPGIGKLWAGLAGYGEDQTVDLVQDLAIRALLQIADGTTGSPAGVTIHDLLRDFMAAELGEAGRLAAHRAIVEAYRQTQVGAGWATVLDDGYLYDHLVYHLEQIADHEASAVTELQSLFANDAWLQVRVSGAGYRYDSYLADLDVVWWRAHQETIRQIEAGEEPAALAECVRYALIRTSMNSLSSNYDPSLVARAVETGLWAAERAVSVALKSPTSETRAAMLSSILAVTDLPLKMHEAVVGETLVAALAIKDEIHRVEALVILVPYLSSEDKTYAILQGFATALAINDEWPRSRALSSLAPHLQGELLMQGFAAASAVKNESHRAKVLVALVPQLPQEFLTQTLAAALAFEDKWSCVQVLIALMPYLPEREKLHALTQALAYTTTIKEQGSGALMLAALAPHLPENQKAAVLAEGLAIALTIKEDWFRAHSLEALSSHLSGEDKIRALAHALEAVLEITTSEDQAWALVALAPYLSGELLAQALAAAYAIEYSQHRVWALAALAPHLSCEERQQALAHGLTVALAIEDEPIRANALACLAPHLSGELLVQRLAAALAIRDEWCCTKALAALAPHLSGSLLAQALAVALAIGDEEFRVNALVDLVPHLPGEEKTNALVQGLATALNIQYERSRAYALVRLAPHLSGELLTQALTAALAIQDEWSRAQALTTLAPHLSGDLLTQALAAALAIQDERHRAEVLAALAPQLLGEEKIYALGQGLAAALAISDNEYCAKALATLAPQLSGEEKALAKGMGLVAALVIQDKRDRARALAALAPQFSGEEKAYVLGKGLTTALKIQDEWSRTQALTTLAPHLSGDLLTQALVAALAIQDKWHRAEALAALAPQILGVEKTHFLAESLVAALAIQEERSRAHALVRLAPQLAGETLTHGVAGALAIRDVEYRGQALVAFLPAIQDNETILKEIRSTISHRLWSNLRYQKRKDLLFLCSEKMLFHPPIFDANTLSRIAADIIEICRHWTWL